MTAYVNIHGQPLDVSAKDAVRAIVPEAIAKRQALMRGDFWKVWRSGHPQAVVIGTGASEESAWRDAWSRMLADDVAKEARP